MTDIIPHYFKSELFFQLIRSSELVLFYGYLYNWITNYNSQQRNKSLFLFLIIAFNSYFNYYLKNNLSKPLFTLFNDYIPILGQGSRPDGAVDCGYFTTCPNKQSTSFGFPSGHSQFSGLYSGFMIRDMLFDDNNVELILDDNKKVSIFVHIIYIFIMMYSRIYIQGCHTIGQAIFGALIGLVIGYFSNILYKNFLKKIKKNKKLEYFINSKEMRLFVLFISFIFMIFA
tara:strand:+ start:1857 stop:2543 length:687 start_codon:yes stop_codon:yes gene_type:complete